MVEKLFTVEEAAKLFSVKPLTIRQWLREKKLRGVKAPGGHFWRIPESAIDELANQKYGDSNA